MYTTKSKVWFSSVYENVTRLRTWYCTGMTCWRSAVYIVNMGSEGYVWGMEGAVMYECWSGGV